MHPVPLAWIREPVGEFHAPTPAEVAAAIARIDEDPNVVWQALMRCVHLASYWDPPDSVQLALATREFREPLIPIAERVLASPAASWWQATTAPEQFYVDMAGDVASLADWRGIEARTPRPKARFSFITTPALPDVGPTGLWLVEDSPLLPFAQTWPLTYAPEASIYEIDGPEAWLALIEMGSQPVLGARATDFPRATGLDCSWVEPDVKRLADSFDALHLTAGGYLTAAGRPLPLGPGRATLVADWSPGETLWLSDVVVPAGRPQLWTGKQGTDWRRL